jgi:ABC-type sugar transport system permease subunit
MAERSDTVASGEAGRPSGTERFAAAMSKSRGSMSSGPVPSPRVRKARRRLTHVDPWSVMKTAFLLSIALGIVTVVAVGIVWSVLGAAGVWDSVDSTVGTVVGEDNDFAIQDYLGMGRVMGFTVIVAVVDVVLVTVLATLGAFLYNLAAALLGGVEVVLAEDVR